MATHRGRQLVVFALLLTSAAPRAAASDPATWSTMPYLATGQASARSGNLLFFATERSGLRRDSGAGPFAVLAADDAVVVATASADRVTAIASDGAGGWYVGRLRNTAPLGYDVVRVRRDGDVDGFFALALNSPVYAIAVAGSTVAVGGYFSSANGVARSSLALVDATTGAVQSAAPAVNAAVYTMAISGNTLYAGGNFTTANGVTRQALAAFDITTGALRANFIANLTTLNGARALVADSGALFVGGVFTAVNGTARTNIAKLDAATGTLDPAWTPNIPGFIEALDVDATSVYVGGQFTAVNGQSRRNLGAVTRAGGATTPWRADVNNEVWSIDVAGSVVYVGGTFTTIGDELRARVAAVTAGQQAQVLPWRAGVGGGGVQRIVAEGGRVALGGTFDSAGVVQDPGVTAIDLVTGERVFHVPVKGTVTTLVATPTRLVIGGALASVADAPRHNLAVMDLTTRQLVPVAPDLDGPVGAVAIAGSTLFIGGGFSTVNGLPRKSLAAIDLSTGAVLAWAPATDGTVVALATVGTDVLVGGSFTSVQGSNGALSRSALARITTAGAVVSFDALISPGAIVYSILVADGVIYVGGTFDVVRGLPRRNVAAIVDGGGILPWNPAFDREVYGLAASTRWIYVAGRFTTARGQARPGLVRVTKSGFGDVDVWQPPAGEYRRVAAYDDAVIATAFVAGGAVLPDLSVFPELVAAGVPGAPIAPIARAVGDALTLHWDPPILGPRPLHYLLEAGTAPGLANLASIPVGGTFFAVAGVPPGRYYFQLRSVGAAGPGGVSTSIALVVGAPGCSTPPQTLDAPRTSPAAGFTTISWTPRPGAPPAAYTLVAGTEPGAYNLGAFPMGGQTSVTGLVPPGVYYVRVVAENACGTRGPGAETALRVAGAAGPPPAPVAAQATVTGNTVAMAWTSPPDGLPLTGHVLEAGTGPGLGNLGAIPLGAGTAFAVGGVPPGVYYVRIRAVNPLGRSAPSNEVSLVVP